MAHESGCDARTCQRWPCGRSISNRRKGSYLTRGDGIIRKVVGRARILRAFSSDDPLGSAFAVLARMRNGPKKSTTGNWANGKTGVTHLRVSARALSGSDR